MTFSRWGKLVVWMALGVGLFACSRCQPARRSAPQQERPIRLMAVGDILLGDAAQSTLERHGYDYPFRRLKPLFKDADLIVGNLEAPMTARTQPIDPKKAYLYKTGREAARALKAFGMNLLCLANNHTLDYGVAGMRDTQRALEAVGIGHFGAGKNLREALKGAVLEVAGVRLGFLAFMEPYGTYRDSYNYFAKKDHAGVAPLSKRAIREAVAALRPQVDVLVAFVHWGKNYKPVTPSQRKWGHRLAHMGFDLVLGHHPHVAQGLEVVNGVPILYSLGNFTFGTPGRFSKVDPIWRHGWVVDIRIEAGRVAQIDLIPIEVDNRLVRFQPRPANPDILPRLLPFLGKDLGTRMEIVTGRARLRLDNH